MTILKLISLYFAEFSRVRLTPNFSI